jgi:hypothetical protein
MLSLIGSLQGKQLVPAAGQPEIRNDRAAPVKIRSTIEFQVTETGTLEKKHRLDAKGCPD